MDHTEFRDALDRLGFTQLGTADLLGYGIKAPQRWARKNSTPVPESVAVLLRLLIAKKITTDDILNARSASKPKGKGK